MIDLHLLETQITRRLLWQIKTTKAARTPVAEHRSNMQKPGVKATKMTTTANLARPDREVAQVVDRGPAVGRRNSMLRRVAKVIRTTAKSSSLSKKANPYRRSVERFLPDSLKRYRGKTLVALLLKIAPKIYT
jgi:hypothetical protein